MTVVRGERTFVGAIAMSTEPQSVFVAPQPTQVSTSSETFMAMLNID